MKNLKVAKVINQDMIVINGGVEDGIKEGMRFLVYAMGNSIIDPDTEEDLGALELPKGFYKTKHIQDKISTLISENPSNVFSNISSLSNILGSVNTDTEDSLKKSIKSGDSVKILSTNLLK